MSSIFFSFILLFSLAQANDTLASWNDSKSKNNIIAYLTSVTDSKSSDLIPVKDRIAVFDNDGTLWSEQSKSFSIQTPRVENNTTF